MRWRSPGRFCRRSHKASIFVALDRLTSADLIVQAVAEVLPISLASREDPLSRITDYLRDKTILLVMDNYEHVLDGVGFVQEILQGRPTRPDPCHLPGPSSIC